MQEEEEERMCCRNSFVSKETVKHGAEFVSTDAACGRDRTLFSELEPLNTCRPRVPGSHLPSYVAPLAHTRLPRPCRRPFGSGNLTLCPIPSEVAM